MLVPRVRPLTEELSDQELRNLSRHFQLHAERLMQTTDPGQRELAEFFAYIAGYLREALSARAQRVA